MEDRETVATKYRIIKGKSGRTWLVGLQPNAAEKIYVTNNPSNTTSKSQGFEGFGGATIEFELEDGGVFEAHGPWHANPDAMYADAGVDFRQLNSTRVTVSTERGIDNKTFRMPPAGEIIYEEKEPVLGRFRRGEVIGRALVNLYQRDLWVFSESNGGSSSQLMKWESVND